METIISKAATLLEALPYIQRFRSQMFVVKYGGSFMDSPDEEERHRVARDGRGDGGNCRSSLVA
jgi:acetylglutamate kinase